MKKIYDQHVHSHYSFDSEQTIKEYLDKAVRLGLDYFVLTDHFDLNYLDKGKDISFDIDAEQEELDTLQKQYSNIKILKGIEIGYKPSEVDRINSTIKKYGFDLINFSLHESDGIDYYFKEEFLKRGIRDTLNLYFQRELEAIENFHNYDVFCHLDYGFKTAYLADNSSSIKDYEDIITKIMKALIKDDKTLEINIKVQSVLPIEHTQYLLRLYKKLGGKYLTLSTDAHDVSKFYEGYDKYLKLIKDEGFAHLSYFINRQRHLYSFHR